MRELDAIPPAQAQATFGPYRLLRRVASGPRGDVHEAFDPGLGQRLAVRVFPADAGPPCADGEPACSRGEGSAATQLQHPNIVKVHDWGWQGRTAFAATAFVEGETLAHHLARVGSLPVLQGLALAAQLLSALQFAHSRQVVHAAINLDNLLVSRGGQLKVAGFGWAADPALVPVRPGLFDAPACMAPEQVRGLQADHRSDLYSAAAVAYELLSARALRPELPAGLAAVFERALAPNPDARYQSADEFSAALQAAVGTPLWVRSGAPAVPARIDRWPEPLEVPEPEPAARVQVTPRAPPWTHRAHRMGRVLVMAFAAAVFVGAGLVVLEPSPTASAPEVMAGAATAKRAGDRREPFAAPVQAVVLPAAAPAASPPAAVARAAAPPEEQFIDGPEPAVIERIPASRSTPARAAVPASPRGSASLRNDVRPGATRVSPPRSPAARTAGLARVSQRAGPDVACRQGLGIARDICKAVRCATAEFSRHPLCVRMHAEQRARNAERDWNN